jgi:hypothetical protein
MLADVLNMMRGCRFLADVVLADDAGFLPESLRGVLKDFVYAYVPRLRVAAIVCWRGGVVTVTLIHDSDAVHETCLRACARAALGWLGWVNAIDALDTCRRECRSAADDLARQDVENGVKLLRDLLKSAGISHKVEKKTDNSAVLTIVL